jgi:hypothetical protein
MVMAFTAEFSPFLPNPDAAAAHADCGSTSSPALKPRKRYLKKDAAASADQGENLLLIKCLFLLK